ncbi:MAG: hypothetical protein M1831_005618 [Alyxoria varia]|nr:MAG: hypothetical protein M1831_005618 [Alyxoria varia]
MSAPVQPLQPLRNPTGPTTTTPEQKYWRTFKNTLHLPSPSSNPITCISHPQPLTASTSSTSTTPTPDHFAVTSGPRILIFSSRTRQLLKSISRFQLSDTARSGQIRRDGRAVLAAGDSGTLQVFDANSRAILKTWREHKQPVWCAKWDPRDLTGLMSAGDDKTVRLWDLSASESVATCEGHQDYVRCGGYMTGQTGGMLVTGSYDSTVRLWDPRGSSTGRNGTAMIFKHNAPVENVLPMPAGTTLLSAADNQISVLDLVAAKPLATLKSHQKSVTALSLASGGSRVVSGALDGHVKIFDTNTWTVVAGSKYPSPILSLDVITTSGAGGGPKQPTGSSSVSGPREREDRHLAVGLQSGILTLKTRLSGVAKSLQKARDRSMNDLLTENATTTTTNTAAGKKRKANKTPREAHQQRAASQRAKLENSTTDYVGDAAEIVIEGNGGAPAGNKRRKKLQEWDSALRRGEYVRALDCALKISDVGGGGSGGGVEDKGSGKHRQKQKEGKNGSDAPSTTTTLTVLTALIHRSALHTALRGRDEVTLLPILRFLSRLVVDPRHSDLVCRVAVVTIELYSEDLGSLADGGSGGGGGGGADDVGAQQQQNRKGQSGAGGNGSGSGSGREIYRELRGLHAKVRQQVESAQAAWGTRGMLEMVVAAG